MLLGASLYGQVSNATQQGATRESSSAQAIVAKVAPVKALLILGGCCHDYEIQKELIKQGLEERAHIEVTVVHQGGTGTSAEIELYRNPIF